MFGAGRRLDQALAARTGGNYGVALDLWVPLAHRVHARAQSNMGAAFLEGGVERDPAKAVDWLRRAAEQGDVVDAQDMLSWMKLLGGGCMQDCVTARAWAEKAAAQGRTAAMARLGDMHHNARGVPRDPALAARWWEQAARLGHAEAQAMPGSAHLAGKGVACDRERALHRLEQTEAGGAGERAAGFLKFARKPS